MDARGGDDTQTKSTKNIRGLANRKEIKASGCFKWLLFFSELSTDEEREEEEEEEGDDEDGSSDEFTDSIEEDDDKVTARSLPSIQVENLYLHLADECL